MNLITGANGRIGNVVVRKLLEKGEKVRIFARNTSNLSSLKGLEYEVANGDINDLQSVLMAMDGCDQVYHLAADININNKDADKTFKINIQGTENILQACIEKKVKRLVYVSSIHAFSLPPKGQQINEETPLCDEDDKRGVYDRSKAKATRKVLNTKAEGFEAVVVCPTGVVGPYDFEPSFFGKGMIESIQSGLKITVPGGFDYVDVRDVADGIISAMKNGKSYQIYLLGNEYRTMKEYFGYLAELSGIPVKTTVLPFWLAKTMGYVLNLFSDNSSITDYSVDTLMENADISHEKASKELGYKPRSMKESITDQYNWFKDNGYFKTKEK